MKNFVKLTRCGSMIMCSFRKNFSSRPNSAISSKVCWYFDFFRAVNSYTASVEKLFAWG